MYCTYCRKEVSSPHRCEETVHRIAHLHYIQEEIIGRDRNGAVVTQKNWSSGYMARTKSEEE